MNRITESQYFFLRGSIRSWRLAGIVAVAGMSLTAMPSVLASPPTSSSPMTTSPFTPWYYSALGFHHGGVNTGVGETDAASSANLFGLPWAQSWGIDTNIYPPYNSQDTGTKKVVNPTEIPSYVLGNYRGYNEFTGSLYDGTNDTPNLEGTETGGNNADLVNFAPDHNGGALFNNFRDSSFLSWSAPFTWTINNSQSPSTETMDDDINGLGHPATTEGTAPAGASPGTNPTWTGSQSLTANGVWPTFTLNTSGSATWNKVDDSTLTQSATNNSYYVADVAVVPGPRPRSPIFPAPGATASATWSFTVRNTGTYSLFVNIPDRPDYDVNVANSGQTRIVDAEYTVIKNGDNANPLFQGVVSQTEANKPQYVAGPYLLQAGDTISLVLDNTTTMQGLPDPNHTTVPGVVVADSATLAVTSGHEVRGGAAVINKSDYPEIAKVSYYGILAGTPGTVNGTTYATAQADPDPFGYYTLDKGTAAGASAATPPQHDVRELAYFGDSEVSTAVAYDSNGNPYTYQHYVGAMYCVDALRGNVVWRYQCPDDINNVTGLASDNGVFTTPVVTRINVMDPVTHNTDANQLVVIFGDQNGKVYCLDAIGNGILMSNTISDGTASDVRDSSGNTKVPNEYTQDNPKKQTQTVTNYSIPLDGTPNTWNTSGATPQVVAGSIASAVLNPLTFDALGTGVSTVSLFAGTKVYWVFRPDPNNSKLSNQTLDYASDDSSSTTGMAFSSASLNSGFDTDGSTVIQWNPPPTSTPTTSTTAVGGEYSTVAAVNATSGTANPAKAATAVYTLQLSTLSSNPSKGTYDVDVTIPPNTSPEVRTKANYIVQVETSTGTVLSTPFSGRIDQNNTTSATKNIKLCSVNIQDLTEKIVVTIDNTSTTPATNPTTSATTGETIVADSAYLEISTPVDPKSLMPPPGAFNEASPAVYVEPGTFTVDTAQSNYGPTDQADKSPSSNPNPAAPTPPTTNGQVGTAYLYVTNSNGTIYSLDPSGALVTAANLYQSTNIDPLLGSTPSASWTPTVNVRWWYTIRKDQQTTNKTHIDSAPSIVVPNINGDTKTHRIFFATAGESTNASESDGRVYALDFTGPVDSKGNVLNPTDSNGRPTATTGNFYSYNTLARPAWSFPDAYGTPDNSGNGSKDYTVENAGANGVGASALGDITGTPVPFYNPKTGETRIYFGADAGRESNSAGTAPSRQPPFTTGRIWSVQDIDEPWNVATSTHTQSCWAFPSANDPNDAANANVEPQKPIGAFYHATPAIGWVQFPLEILNADSTEWVHNDVVYTDAAVGVRGNTVPMLYIGCNGDTDQGFYALDLYGGDPSKSTVQLQMDDNADANNIDDINRQIYRLESPNGFAWTSSPALIVNQQANPNHVWDKNSGAYVAETSSSVWGGGGAIFATGGNTLYQISATPVTNLNPSSKGPLISIDKQFQGFGPLSSPSVGACNVSGLENTKASANSAGTSSTDANNPITNLNDANAIYADPNQVTEWVFCGDQANGVFRGITPNKQGFGVGAELSAEMPSDTDQGQIQAINARLPLHAYIGASAKNSSDMTTDTLANGGGPGGMLSMGTKDTTSFFDWGQSVYVRITNVVPPNPGDKIPANRMYDPTGQLDKTKYYLTNGSPVSYTITEVPANQVNAGSTFTDYQASGSTQVLGSLPGDGFKTRSFGTDPCGYVGSDDYDPATNYDPNLSGQTLTDYPGNREWIYASTYFIGNGTGHSDTPGATRRIINATQTCQVYQFNPGKDITDTNPGIPTNNTVTLTTELSQGSQYQVTDTNGNVTGLAQTVPSPDPTFGIANPLSVIGAGVGVDPSTSTTALFGLGGLGYSTSSAPYRPVSSPYPSGSDTNGGLDMQSNGNFVYASQTDLPTAGLTMNYDPTQPNSGGANTTNTFTPNGEQAIVETDLGYIHDGKAGSNAIPPSGLTTDSTTTFGDMSGVSLNMGDRSQVGLRGMSIKVNLKDVPAQWYDSTSAHGPGQRINPLPWEDIPTSYDFGANSSNDYPDIGLNNLDVRLNTVSSTSGVGPRQGRSGELIGGSATLDPRDEDGSANQYTYSDTVKVTLNVPKYQPANILYEYPPTSTSYHLPDGYVVTEREFVDTNNNGQWDQGEAYRDFNIKMGVPINAATHMGDSTIDIGSVPGGFGVQMDPYMSALDQLLGTGTNAPDVFSPYTTYFQKYFQPVTVYNDGNINLLNVHLDQKWRTSTTDPTKFTPLYVTSPAVDVNAAIPAWDVLGITRPDTNGLPGSMTSVDPSAVPSGGSGTSEQPFLLRSSLDTDLVQAYGRNPNLFLNYDAESTPKPWSSIYQGATFHKARAGASSPSILTVPDVSNATDRRDPWYFPVDTSSTPKLQTNGSVDTPTAATVPYVSLAVPLGAPAGKYSQSIALFDGTDYNFNAITVPSYGALTGGLYGTIDTYLDGGHLVSNPSAELTVSVREHRMTDAQPDYANASGQLTGIVDGALKDIPDTVNSKITTQPDFYPAAVRDLYWTGSTVNGTGDLSMLWASARGSSSSGSYPALTLSSAVLGTGSDGSGRFQAQTDSTTAANNHWWTVVDDLSKASTGLPAGINSAVSLAQDQPIYDPGSDSFNSDGSDYAFWINTDTEEASSSTGNTGLTTVWCAKYDPTTGSLTGTPFELTPTPATASGNTQPVTAAMEGAYDVRGLKYSVTGTSGQLYLQDPNKGTAITNNLWVFWTVGGHGQSAIYYESGAGGASPTFTGTPIALPVPAGLSGVSDPSPIIIPAPDTTAAESGSATGAYPPATVSGSSLVPPTVPLIEVTYSGVNQAGSSDIYVSRYRPYLPDPTATQNVALWPVPYPLTNEQLRREANGNWWSARDIGWVRNDQVNLYVNGSSVFTSSTVGKYDKASGLLVYTNVNVGNAVYIDLPHGRVRFSPALPANSAVNVWVNPMARRITSSVNVRANTEPISFVDTAFANNEAVYSGSASSAPRAQAGRYWFIYRKAGSGPSDTIGATLWSNTQRLGIPLYDQNGTGVGVTVDPTQVGNMTVVDQTTGATLYPNPGGPSAVDIDWAHGYVFFPLLVADSTSPTGWSSPEGHYIKVMFMPRNGSQITEYDNVHWVDEPRYNEGANSQGANGSAVTVSNGGKYVSAMAATTSNEVAVPIENGVNESMPWAFLDPVAYADRYAGPLDPFGLYATAGATVLDQPHRVWLFWSSSRNAGSAPGSKSTGNAASDLYYEALAPAFGATP